MIYKRDILNIGRKNILYPSLLMSFFAYYLAENNWLSGRDNMTGIAVFGAITGLILIITFLKIYRINSKIAIIFGMAITFLALSTIIDASVDGYVNVISGIGFMGLIEEVIELYASMFFLHSLILVYTNSNPHTCLKEKNWQPLIRIMMYAVVLSYFNSILLFDHSEQIPFQRLMVGFLMITVVLSVLFISFFMKRSQRNSIHTYDSDFAMSR